MATDNDGIIRIYPEGGGDSVFLFTKNKKIEGSDAIKAYMNSFYDNKKKTLKRALQRSSQLTVALADFKTKAQEMNKSTLLDELKQLNKPFNFSAYVKDNNAVHNATLKSLENLGERAHVTVISKNVKNNKDESVVNNSLKSGIDYATRAIQYFSLEDAKKLFPDLPFDDILLQLNKQKILMEQLQTMYVSKN